MTFLAPFAAAWWLLALLPILVHLFNRLRHRKLPWAAMMFLRMANRKSTRYAKLRQWLVLLFRVLAVVTLLFALSRPLVGGWIGGMFTGRPDVILIILDGSASMGAQTDKGDRYSAAVDLMAKTADQYGDGVRLVMMHHTDERPREVKDVQALRNLAGRRVTDTAADLPALLEAAANWFKETKPGRGEIWIASDLQASNWDPSAKERWSRLANKLDGLSQKVRVQLMAFNQPLPYNVSVRVAGVKRHRVFQSAEPGRGGPGAEHTELELQIELTRESVIGDGGDYEISPFIDGHRYPIFASMGDSLQLTLNERIRLRDSRERGSGVLSLNVLEDGNENDNVSYFVYGPLEKAKTAVVGNPNAFTTRFLNLVAAPNPANTNHVSEIIEPSKAWSAPWSDFAMVVWQGALPLGDTADNLTDYLKAGGVMVCFPDDDQAGEGFNGVKWGPVDQALEDGKEFGNWQALAAAEEGDERFGFVIDNWNYDEGPFKSTEEGLYLPVGELRINLRRPILHDKGTVLASLSDGATMVLRKNIGKGQLVFFGTQPSDRWSSLTEGIVLVPALKRLLMEGNAMSSGRFIEGRMLSAGDDRSRSGERWLEVGSDITRPDKAFDTDAGIYRLANSQRVVAVNRPAREDSNVMLEPDSVQRLFGEVPLALTQKRADGAAEDPKEIWKWFLAAMALALLIEGFLVLPKSTDERVEIQSSITGKVPTQQAN